MIVYDKKNSLTLDVTVTESGSSVTEFALDGTPSTYANYDGNTLGGVELTPMMPRVFLINP